MPAVLRCTTAQGVCVGVFFVGCCLRLSNHACLICGVLVL